MKDGGKHKMKGKISFLIGALFLLALIAAPAQAYMPLWNIATQTHIFRYDGNGGYIYWEIPKREVNDTGIKNLKTGQAMDFVVQDDTQFRMLDGNIVIIQKHGYIYFNGQSGYWNPTG